MRIIFAAAEVAPYAKVGGLADVAGSLPQALAALGHDVRVYVPYHRTIDEAKFGIPASGRTRSVPYGAAHARIEYPEITRDGARVVFVRSFRIGRDKVYGYPDDAKRYALFCRAVLADLADGPPDVVHAHDWHAALLVPLAAKARELRGSATAFTIHNLAYQGRTSADVLRLVGLARSRLAIEGRDEANPMARAIAAADVVSTVSERYAEEILQFVLGLRLLHRGLGAGRGDEGARAAAGVRCERGEGDHSKEAEARHAGAGRDRELAVDTHPSSLPTRFLARRTTGLTRRFR